MSGHIDPLADRETYLRALERESSALKDVSRRINDMAIAARVAGASWREIGESMDVSPQAAQQRFGPFFPSEANEPLAGQEPAF